MSSGYEQMNLELIACLSPGEMWISTQVGYYAATFCIGIAIALIFLSVQQRSWVWAPVYGFLLLLHPAWAMGVTSGDCGMSKRFFSVAVCLVMVAVLTCQTFWPRLSIRRFILVLCGICWIVYVPIFLSFVLHFPLFFANGLVGTVIQSVVFSSRNILGLALVLSIVSVVLWFFHKVQNRHELTKPTTAE